MIKNVFVEISSWIIAIILFIFKVKIIAIDYLFIKYLNKLFIKKYNGFFITN